MKEYLYVTIPFCPQSALAQAGFRKVLKKHKNGGNYMVQYHKPSKTKSSGSGGLKRSARDKRLANYGGFFSRPHLTGEKDKEDRKSFKVRGGKMKVGATKISFANIVVEGKVRKVKIKNVMENPADRHFARENIITRGAIIDTELGKARVTSRPGQDGIANAILVKG